MLYEVITTLFRVAFPECWERMRQTAAGENSVEGPLREKWEAVLELARRALSPPVPGVEPVRSSYNFV